MRTDSVAPVRFRTRRRIFYELIASLFDLFLPLVLSFFLFPRVNVHIAVAARETKGRKRGTVFRRDKARETMHKLQRIRQRRGKRDSRNYARGHGAI